MSGTRSGQQLKAHRSKLRDVLGPGLITGASDDDPSGIATYSQAGAQFGYSMGWTLLFTYPLMCAIQLICAQIGRVTGRGIAGNMRCHYPAPLLPLHELPAVSYRHPVLSHGFDDGWDFMPRISLGGRLAWAVSFGVDNGPTCLIEAMDQDGPKKPVFSGVGIEHRGPCLRPQLYRGKEAVAPGLNVDFAVGLAREHRFKGLRSGA